MTVISLQGQRVLLTGATKGIGLAIAERLAAMGACLMLNARSETDLNDLFTRLQPIAQQAGGDMSIYAGSVADAAVVAALVDATVERFGRLDILINNAGVAPKFGLLQESALEDLDRTLDINLKGPIYLSYAAVPVMVNQGGGTILNMNSVAGKTAYPYSAVYCASKFGLTGLTEALALEQRANGIRVIGIYPGEVDTTMWEVLEPGVTQDSGTMLSACDVTDAVVFVLTQGGNNYITDVRLIPLRAVQHG